MNIIFSLFFFLASGFELEVLPEQKTNLQIADSLTILILTDQLPEMKINHADSLALDVLRLEPEIQNYLRVLVGNWFLQNSFQVFRNYNAGSSFQGMVLEINKYNLEIVYSKPYEKSLLGADYIRRQISLDLHGQFYDAGRQKVQHAVRKTEIYTDEIPYADINRVDESAFPFTKGQREDYSLWDKLYEPVLTVTSVAILVYLFFSRRT
jgi:hypothetical protein